MLKHGYYYGKLLRHFSELKTTKTKNLAHLVTSALLKVLTFLLIPLMASKIISSLQQEDYNSTLINIMLFAIVAIIYVSCHHYNFWAYYINTKDIHNNLQKQILKKVTEFDTNYTASIPKATVISTAFQDVEEVCKVPDYLCDTITDFIGIIINVMILCVVDFRIGLIASVLLITSTFTFVRHTKKRDYFRFIQRERADDIAGLYSQIIDGYKEVKTLNLKSNLSEHFTKSKDSWRKYHKKQRLHRDLAAGAIPFIIGLGRVLVYLVCIDLILKGEYTIAALILVLGYYENIVTRYDRICNSVDNISRSSIAIERLHRLLFYKTSDMIDFGKNSEDDIKGSVKFDHVYFAYDEPPKKSPDGTIIKRPIKKAPKLKDVSFSIQPMTLTAIVGKSGSGKSTIFRLLLRLYKTTKGQILLDDENIYNYSKKVYATNVSIVTQKPFMFDLTIRENLDLVSSDRKSQIAACKTVGIHDTIMKLKNGYDTPLRRDGENLSAGQKQLLSLARTLLSTSEVLLFDEVTSSLDATTSDRIIKTLKKLKKDHTVIMITHKPELMRMADRIIVIDNGKIVGKGTHEQLIKRSKIYRELQKLA